MPERLDAVHDRRHYLAFYRELGEKYPESELIHADRSPGTRFWTVLHELEPFAREGGRLLDVGCNDGVYTIPYCLAGGRALGIDLSPALVTKAQEAAARASAPSCSFREADIESPDVADAIADRFDVVLFSEVLEHLMDPDRALRNVRALLRPGGALVLTVPTAFFGVGPQGMFRHLPRTLVRGPLLVPRTSDAGECGPFQERGIAPYLYRHDGYYPLALRRYVEGFGFRCERAYTITFPHLVVRALGWWSLSSREKEARGELLARRLPVLNLLGKNNVAIFRRGEPASERP